MFTVAPARCLVMLSVVIGLACSASQTGSSQSRTSFYCNNNLPSQGIEEAFLRDNFTVGKNGFSAVKLASNTRVVKNATFEGVRGFLAHSLNATVLKTGAPKVCEKCRLLRVCISVLCAQTRAIVAFFVTWNHFLCCIDLVSQHFMWKAIPIKPGF